MPSHLPKHLARALLSLMLLALLPGCARHLASRIVEPRRNPSVLDANAAALHKLGLRFELLARDPEPDIAFLVVEPGDYRLRTRVFHFEGSSWSYNFGWKALQQRAPARHGTVVLSHGWAMDASMMLPWAIALAESGFRAVVVELRNHGRSGSAPAGFGLREADDLLAVIARLEQQHRLARPLHLFGISYGAVTSLHAAARLGDEVGAVVAVEPFANAADAVRDMRAFVRDGPARSLRGWLLRLAALGLVREPLLEDAIDRASQQLGLELRELDTADVVAEVVACPLFVHGRVDTVVPYLGTRRLAAANERAQLIELPKDGHFSTAGRIDLLGRPLANWLRAVRAGAPCPRFDAPKLPLLAFDGFEGEWRNDGARRIRDAGAVRIDPHAPDSLP